MDIEDMFEDDQPGSKLRRLASKRVMKLPDSASIKEDLQEIYTIQEEIGTIAWRIHKILSEINDTADNNSSSIETLKKSNDELIEQLEAFSRFGDRIKEKLDTLLEYAENTNDIQEKIMENWKAITIAVNATLEANGYDPQTLMRKDMELKKVFEDQQRRREHIQQAIISTIIGVISTVILWAYGRAIRDNQAETNQTIMEVLKSLKK